MILKDFHSFKFYPRDDVEGRSIRDKIESSALGEQYEG